MPVVCLAKMSLEPWSFKLLLQMFSLCGVASLDDGFLLSVSVDPKGTGRSDSPGFRSTFLLDG